MPQTTFYSDNRTVAKFSRQPAETRSTISYATLSTNIQSACTLEARTLSSASLPSKQALLAIHETRGKRGFLTFFGSMAPFFAINITLHWPTKTKDKYSSKNRRKSWTKHSNWFGTKICRLLSSTTERLNRALSTRVACRGALNGSSRTFHRLSPNEIAMYCEGRRRFDAVIVLLEQPNEKSILSFHML